MVNQHRLLFKVLHECLVMHFSSEFCKFKLLDGLLVLLKFLNLYVLISIYIFCGICFFPCVDKMGYIGIDGRFFKASVSFEFFWPFLTVFLMHFFLNLIDSGYLYFFGYWWNGSLWFFGLLILVATLLRNRFFYPRWSYNLRFMYRQKIKCS